ncbi:hypothetical protein TPY_2058 [Sulfobacillus acidophilus TPY]|uniref:Uncharacterized protein n=1 Tax=Sulfobacillus acidophilus (strain ATCC 700253 / DSM 10332 / NAL) TaxID=679936 RepID=G8U010_SULAD|nr:hypothetical protein TPY_2058 [Sulfobacillus acidophilus TPY]AEW04179.1 hypothetical protein Sulac_0669 [Sulfobacillus acidophilus DSM 10332]
MPESGAFVAYWYPSSRSRNTRLIGGLIIIVVWWAVMALSPLPLLWRYVGWALWLGVTASALWVGLGPSSRHWVSGTRQGSVIISEAVQGTVVRETRQSVWPHWFVRLAGPVYWGIQGIQAVWHISLTHVWLGIGLLLLLNSWEAWITPTTRVWWTIHTASGRQVLRVTAWAPD